MRAFRIFFLLPPLCIMLWLATRGTAQNNGAVPRPAANGAVVAGTDMRPYYKLKADIDFDLLTFKADGEITVPVQAGDTMRDAVFFIFANAGGVGGDDERRKNIAVDSVTFGGRPVSYKLDGAVLRVNLPTPQTSRFALSIAWHGVVPRSPAGSGGIADMMGGMSSDIGGLLGGFGDLGGAQTSAPAKPKNVDYGLYTYGNGILSLGSFWYPSLAVRRGGKWVDEAPEGLGDVAYAEMSDYLVTLSVPQNVKIAAPGQRLSVAAAVAAGEPYPQAFELHNARDFAVVMSEDYTVQSKVADIGGKLVRVEAYTTKQHAAKSARAIDVAANALNIYARRFGAYPYDRFVVAEAPMRGGAGGMEYSGMTGIASMLYQDLVKELGGLSQSLGAGPLDKFMGELDQEAFGDGTPAMAPAATAPAAKASAARAPAIAAPASKAAPAPRAAPVAPAPEMESTDNPAADFLKSTLGQQADIFSSLFEATIAHETAHQWWAIGVGSDSQRAPWLDESLTNYSSMIYFEDRYGRPTAEKMIELHLKTPYSMGRMLGGGDAPANLKTSAYANNVQYGAVIYGKGALFYDALRHTVGDAVFYKSLRDYYGAYQNRLAGNDDLINIFEHNAPAKANAIAALRRRWIMETHGDEDITGGKPMGLEDLLGSMMGGLTGAE